MMKTITIPAPRSALINVLLRVITAPGVPWDVVASAGDLIALDVRFDHWFLTVAKPTASSDEIERLLDLTDQATANVELAWTTYEASAGRDAGELRSRLADACRGFRAVVERGAAPDRDI
jgi:hypothetical protein